MATSRPRPRVVVSQLINKTAGAVLTPSLTPCFVGPCYQIVRPLTATGSINSDAAVITAARVRSDIIGESLSLSGKNLKMSVAGGVPQIVAFPVTRGSAPISRVLVVNTINKALTGASAKIVNDCLDISTTAVGSSARLKLLPVADDAYTLLGLSDFVDIEQFGQSTYGGLSCEISYDDMPADKTAVANVVFDESDLDIYTAKGGKLSHLRADAAPSWDAYVGGSSAVAGISVDRGFQPALANTPVSLHGIRAAGRNTAMLFSVGREARIRIPLAGYSMQGGTASWPDPAAANYLEVTAVGLQDYLASANGAVGPYVGILGNDITVVVSQLDAGEPFAIAVDGDELAIDIPFDGTFAAFKTAIGSAELSGKVTLSLRYAAADAAKACVYEECDIFATYTLGGGLDPTNFDDDTPNVASATLIGCVHIPNSFTGADMGVTGETLSFSIGGGAWKPCTFLAGTSVITTLNSVLDGVATVSRLADGDVKSPLGTAFRPLRMVTTTALGEDSSIAIAGSRKALQNLFGGFSQRTASAVSATATAGYGTTRRSIQLAPSAYNPLAYLATEKSVVPGTVTVKATSVILPAFILAANNDISGLLDDDNSLILHAGAESATITIAVADDATLADIAESLNDELDGSDVELIRASVVTIGSSDYLCLYDSTGVAGTEISIESDGYAFEDLFEGLCDTVATTASGDITFKDSGVDFALQVTAVSNSLVNGVFSTDVLDVTSTDALSDLILDDASARTVISYSTSASLTAGTIRLTLTGDSTVGVEADKTCVVAKFSASQRADVTFNRLWASCARQDEVAYDARVFTGDHYKMIPGDMLLSGTKVLGRIVDVGDLVLGGTTYSGAKLSISEPAVTSGSLVSDWHTDAYGLDDADNARLAPEVVVSAPARMITVKPLLLRSAAGMPITGAAQMYAGYRALRTDIAATKPTSTLLTLTDQDLDRLLGPVSPENPLAWAFYTASLAAPNTVMAALGVDATSADAPYGTPEAYSRALAYLLNKEVYSLALCTTMPSVCDMQNAHVTLGSGETYGKERIAFACRPIPSEKNALVAASGTALLADVGGGKYELTLTDETINVADALDGLKDANGNSISASVGQDFDPAQGVYLDRAGDAYKWLITKIVATNIVQIDTTDIYMPGSGPGTGGNEDGYFRMGTSALADFEADGENCSVCVRQAALTTDTSSGREDICTALSDIATAYQNRRLFIVMPDSITMDYAGTPTKVPAFHAAAQIAAMVAVLPTQQSFSNYPMVGITGLTGSLDTFSDMELGIAAAGGIYWLIQDGDGQPIKCRHQLSTDTSSIETQELSITKPTDLFAKTVRRALSPKPGRNNIDKQFLTELNIDLMAICAQFSGEGRPLASASVAELMKNPNRADGITAKIAKENWIPCNEIYITISN